MGSSGLGGGSGAARLRYIELERCGHCPQHEAPVATAALIGRWLRGEEPLAAGAADEAFVEEHATVHAYQASSDEQLRLSPWERLLTRALG